MVHFRCVNFPLKTGAIICSHIMHNFYCKLNIFKSGSDNVVHSPTVNMKN